MALSVSPVFGPRPYGRGPKTGLTDRLVDTCLVADYLPVNVKRALAGAVLATLTESS